MLVISRKPGERVHIGEDIQVAILEITGSRVVIGIAAPREIAIRRVGPIPYENADAPVVAQAPALAVDPPQPDMQYEYREMDIADLQDAARRGPVVRIKRSRLKVVPDLPEVTAATG